MESLLRQLGLIDISAKQEYLKHTRDRDDITVLKCLKSDIIYLSRTAHPRISYYENKDSCLKNGGGPVDGGVIHRQSLADTDRRFKDFAPLIVGKRWLDFGTGHGEILDQLGKTAQSVAAVEPNRIQRHALQKKGHHIYRRVEDIENAYFDVITLFHVFEHLTDPITVLRKLRSKCSSQGIVIIEVPHARDFLLKTAECEAFKKFTMWSEHLILHTRQSLEAFIRKAGFKDIQITGIQRYPLSNHLYWLAEGKPGGHNIWRHLNDPVIDHAYTSLLQSLDQTDTIVAIAKK